MRLLARLGTFVAALLGSLVGVILVFPFGLVAPEWIVYPLGLGVAAILAALSAGWTGTILAADGTRTRLAPVAGAAAATAAAVALLLMGYLALSVNALPRALLVPPIVIGVICSLLLAMGAGVATWRFRRARQAAGGDVRLTVALLALAVASVPATLVVASLFGLTGA